MRTALLGLLFLACSGAGGVNGTGGGSGGVSGGSAGGSAGGVAGGAAAGGVAGGGSPTFSRSWTGGTRIKATMLRDGTFTTFGGWRDTQLDEPCSWARAADGELRCLPWSVPSVTTGVFADAACTQPAVVVTRDSCATAPRHVVQTDTATCPARQHVFTVGRAVTMLYGVIPGYGCGTKSLGLYELAYAVGAEVPASSLVRVTLTKGTGTGVGINTATADDGATGSDVFFDNASGTDCYPRNWSDSTVRCAPVAPLGIGTHFSEANCTSPAHETASCPAQTGYGVRYDTKPGTACAPDPEYVRLGPALGNWFRQDPWTCMSTPVPTGTFAYGATPLPAGSLPVASVAFDGAGRLQGRVYTWPGGKQTFGSFRDTQLGEMCVTSALASDGSRRCLPATGGVVRSGWYSDASCTQPLAAVTHDGASCTPKFLLDGFDWCGNRARVWRVGARRTGSAYTKDTTGCQSHVIASTSVFYENLGEVAPAEMAPLSESTQ